MQRSVVAVIILVLACVLCSSVSWAGVAITENALDDSGSDSAMHAASGARHVVFERDSGIYYINDSMESEELVAAGSAPSIAVDASNVPHLAFVSGGNAMYTAKSGESWDAPATVFSGSVSSVDIDIDSSGKAHVAIGGGWSGWPSVAYYANTSGSFQAVRQYDGWFDGSPCYCGDYYWSPAIRISSGGNFYFAYRHGDPGSGSGNLSNIVLESDAGGGFTISSPTFNINSTTFWPKGLALDGSGTAYLAYYGDGISYFAEVTSGGWNQTALAGGTDFAVSLDQATGDIYLAYVNAAGGIEFNTDAGAGFTGPVTVDLTTSGRNPNVAFRNGVAHFSYEASDGQDYEVFYSSTGPVISGSLTSHDFGLQEVGNMVAVPLVITNNGLSDLTITGFGTTDTTNFPFDPAECSPLPYTLVPGDNCYIMLRFSPATGGAKSATVSINSNDPDTPTANVAVSGAGGYYIWGHGSSGEGGSITCSPVMVLPGASSTCSITVNADYGLVGLTDNGTDVLSQVAGNEYVLTGINVYHDVSAVFARTYAVTSSVPGGNGSVSCQSPVAEGGTATCTITPSDGYILYALTDNGSDALGGVSGNVYAITNVAEAHEVVATFGISEHAINYSSHGSGSVVCDPASVSHGGSAVCTINADPQFQLQALMDNGVDVKASVVGGQYTLSNVTLEHDLVAYFEVLGSEVLPLQNGDFELDEDGTAGSLISYWTLDFYTVNDGGTRGSGPAATHDLTVTNERSYSGDKSVRSHLVNVNYGGNQNPDARKTTNDLTAAYDVTTKSDKLYLWRSEPEYTTSSRWYWQLNVVLSDGSLTEATTLACMAWGNSEGCNGNFEDTHDQQEEGTDGQTWYRHSIVIPAGMDRNNLTVTVRHQQDSWDGTTAGSTIYYDLVTDYGRDTIPDQFAFDDQTYANTGSQRLSNIITVSGINDDAQIAITACTSSLCEWINVSNPGGEWSSAPGTVSNGNMVRVRQTASDNQGTKTDLTLSIGGVSDTFSVTTAPPLRALTVSKSGDGSGVVTGTEGFNCSSYPCQQDYYEGTVVTLSATVEPGFAFDGWTGCDSASGNQCTVAMTAAKGVTANFRVVTAIKLLSPNGGVTLASGEAGVNIQWEAPASVVNFRLKYSVDNGLTWLPVDANMLAGTSYAWNVPAQIQNRKKCLMKVVGFTAKNVRVGADVSDAPFVIEVVKLTTPNGGAPELASGDIVPITWTTRATKRPVAKVVLYYSKDNGVTWIKIGQDPANSGSYPWTVPAVLNPKPNCKVKVELKDAGGIVIGSDISDAVFAINPAPAP